MKLKSSHYFLFIFALALAVSIILTAFDPVSKALSLRSPSSVRVSVLVMGMDAVNQARHTDTLMLLSYSPSERMLNVLSIPRDTLVNYEGHLRRINEIYSIILARKKKSLIDSADKNTYHLLEKTAAEDFLGVVNATIFKGLPEVKYYAQVDYRFFEELVDNLTGGKIRVEISEPMKYDDFAAGLHIDFSTGIHYLDGKDALKYVRYRGKGSDIRRIARQQKFVVEWISSIKKPLIIWRLPWVIKSFYENVNSNISKWALLNLALIEFRDFDTSNVRFFTLPGRFGGNYWIYDRAPGDFFKIITGTDLPSADYSRRGAADSDKTAGENFPQKNPILDGDIRDGGSRIFTVQVWNASGVTGAARAVRDAMISAGFNVVDWGNYSSVQQEKTLIKNMCEDASAGVIARDTLRFGEVVNKYETNRDVDITIIIGRDYIAP